MVSGDIDWETFLFTSGDLLDLLVWGLKYQGKERHSKRDC